MAENSIASSLIALRAREVEASSLSLFFSSSKSQTLTERTLKVSEISLADAAHSVGSSIALDVAWVNWVQIIRKSYCGRLKWRLTKRFIRCRIFSESSNTARRAMATRTTNAWRWKDAAPP